MKTDEKRLILIKYKLKVFDIVRDLVDDMYPDFAEFTQILKELSEVFNSVAVSARKISEEKMKK